MLHSVIIPHRDRNEHLKWCVWSLLRSARHCDKDVEIIIVDDGSAVRPALAGINLRRVSPNGRWFNKPRLQNIGIEAASGELVSFLDADTLVPRWWAYCAENCISFPVTRLCYRVRILPAHTPDKLEAAASPSELLDYWFRQYDTGRFVRAAEAYGAPETNVPEGEELGPVGPHVFGNSQFTIRRDVLGDLRYDERFVSSGYEDISFLWLLAQHYGDAYLAGILTSGHCALFHIRNEREPWWYNPKMNRANHDRYVAMKKAAEEKK